MKAVRVAAHGGPEVLTVVELPTPKPGPGQVLIAVEAAGVNFIDIYQRTGFYSVTLPAILGQEAAGRVAGVGSDVQDWRVGDRVGFVSGQGAYADSVIVPADRLVPVPKGVSTRDAAAALLQGMTAHYLTTDTYPLKVGDTCLVHAAAGGVGLLLVQVAKFKGAKVIGTVSTSEKSALAREAGADHVINYLEEDFESAVKQITVGRGVQVVYDSVGQATFMKSLNVLSPRGMLVTFGQSSGPVPPIDPLILSQRGSLFLTRPTLWHYVASREALLARAAETLGWVAEGRMKVRIDSVFPLSGVADAHRRLESRRSTGKLLLIP
ncbi:MAG TPA: quinone oxidoreductase [Gemmatimonadales bacterium]|jgi:NADPH2:quinone reductase|nr:quinone oxidoreductase [Gemmatimonadales bacterium]